MQEDKEDASENKRKLNYFEGLVNLLKSILGAGILGAPYGFLRLGWLLALIVATTIIFFIVYCKRILIHGMREICKSKGVEHIKYADAMSEGFKEGPPSFQKLQQAIKVVVKVFIVIFHFCIGPIYVVVISTCVRDVVIQYQSEVDIRIYMACLTPLLIAIFFINDLKKLTPFSFIATIFILAGLLSVIYFMLETKLPPIRTVKLYNGWLCIPTYIGLILMMNASPGVILAIDYSMKKPEQFTAYYGVLNIGMSIIYVLTMAFSFVGYWRYGPDTADNILLNIPHEEIISQVTKILYAIALYFSYPLQLYPVVEIIWTDTLSMKFDSKKHFIGELIVRLVIVILSEFVAIGIPYFGIISALTGCMTIPMLGFVFPCLLDISLRHPDRYGPCRLMLIRDILFIGCGLFILVSGIILSIADFVKTFL